MGARGTATDIRTRGARVRIVSVGPCGIVNSLAKAIRTGYIPRIIHRFATADTNAPFFQHLRRRRHGLALRRMVRTGNRYIIRGAGCLRWRSCAEFSRVEAHGYRREQSHISGNRPVIRIGLRRPDEIAWRRGDTGDCDGPRTGVSGAREKAT